MILQTARDRIGGLTSAAAIRIGGRGLVFVLALVLARELGVEGFGIYSFATTWVTVLLAVSGLGYGSLLLRQTAVYVERGQPEFLLGLIQTARRTIIPLSILLVVVAVIAAAAFFDPIFLVPLVIALPSVIIRTSALIWEGILRGLGRVDESFIPTYIVYPVLMLAGVGLVVVLGDGLSPEVALGIYLLAFTAATVMAWWLARGRLRPILGADTEPAHPETGRYSLLIPFTTLTMLGSLSAGLGMIMLGLLDLPDAVGILSVALKLVEPMMILYGVVLLGLSSRIAALHARGDLGQLQPEIGRVARIGLFWAAPIGLILVLFPDLILSLFGDGFDEAETSLLILVPAFLFSIIAGVGPAALMMTDHQRVAVVIKAAGLGLNLVLCLALIPGHGASAAALALSADIILTNTAGVIVAWKLLGLNTTAFPTPAFLARSSREEDKGQSD